jgi:hypothetical protein
LLDTNVISETRKLAKSLGSEQVKQWFAAQPSESLFLSVISLFEIERGILLIKFILDKGEALLSGIHDNHSILTPLGLSRAVKR